MECANTPVEIPVLYRDEHLVVVHKPAGMAVHSGLGMDPDEVRFLFHDL